MPMPKWWSRNISQFILVIAIALMAGLYRDGFPALFPFMRTEFGVSRAALGMYVSLLYLVSAALAVVAGHLADQFGAKRALFWGAGSLGLLILLHVPAPTFSTLLLLGVISGVGFSIIGPGTNKIVADRFPAEVRGTPMGLMFVGWSAGGLLGALILPTVGEYFGWRMATLVMGLATLAVVGVFQLRYREVSAGGTDDSRDRPVDSRGGLESFREGFAALISDRYMLLLCVAGLVLGAISGTMATHYTLYLHLDLGYPEALAGLGFAFLHAGSIAGRPTWGLINDRLLGGREGLGFLLISISTALILLVFAGLARMFEAPPMAVLFGLTFLAGFSGRGWPGILFAGVARRMEGSHAGMAMGFALVFVRLGITLAPPVFGYVADLTGAYDVSWLMASIMALGSGVILYALGLGDDVAEGR